MEEIEVPIVEIVPQERLGRVEKSRFTALICPWNRCGVFLSAFASQVVGHLVDQVSQIASRNRTTGLQDVGRMEVFKVFL